MTSSVLLAILLVTLGVALGFLVGLLFGASVLQTRRQEHQFPRYALDQFRDTYAHRGDATQLKTHGKASRTPLDSQAPFILPATNRPPYTIPPDSERTPNAGDWGETKPLPKIQIPPSTQKTPGEYWVNGPTTFREG